jgi:hypothetical protein
MNKLIKITILVLILKTTIAVSSLDLSEDTDNKGKVDRWLSVTPQKDWKKYDFNKNNDADESYFYLRDSLVYFIGNEKFDMNKDGKPDIWIKNEIKEADVYTQIDADTNYDGKADLSIFKKNDVMYLKKMDNNKSGIFDQIEEYNDKGIKTSEFIDTNKDGKTDDKYFYDTVNGLLLREEIDSHNSGKADLWVIFEYNDDQSLKRCIIEKDNNKDGNADEWQYSDNKRRIVRVEKDTNFDGKVDDRVDLKQ